MLNLEWFRTFKAIYETGTLSSAAQVLFISQPGVSLHLNALEAYTGYRLFEREPRRMVPTDRAVMLYNFLIEPISKLEKAEELFHRNSKTEEPTISVGMCFDSYVFALEEYLQELPFNLIVKVGEYQKLIHDLEIGAIDLIITPQKGNHAVLEYTPFSKDRTVLICGSLNNTDELDYLILKGNREEIREWLKNQIWYTNAAQMEHMKTFWTLNFDCDPDFKPNFVLPYFSSVVKTLSNGKGFAIVPDSLCKNEIENQSIKLAWQGFRPVENIIYFGKRIKTIFPKEIRLLEEIITRNWQINTWKEANSEIDG
jgi:DNA-binding transcriptional LysR family regulator